ncbi:MAG: GIY-YIG nuclease family protein [bacterium]
MGGLKLKNMYIVYILESGTNRHYIGMTEDIDDRLRHHNSGANKSTKPYRPWKVIHREKYLDKRSAWLREKQIKAYKGGNAFKKLVNMYGEVA